MLITLPLGRVFRPRSRCALLTSVVLTLVIFGMLACTLALVLEFLVPNHVDNGFPICQYMLSDVSSYGIEVSGIPHELINTPVF